jgi:TonB family protein
LKEKQFIHSLEFGRNTTGIEIGNGASRTFGDEAKADENKSEEKSPQIAGDEKNEAMVIVLKPRASYTDEARQAQTQGNVTLRVTFLANGGIGSILPVETSMHGLTEEAIAAAGKIVFLPQKVKGKPINVTKQVQYGFTIY